VFAYLGWVVEHGPSDDPVCYHVLPLIDESRVHPPPHHSLRSPHSNGLYQTEIVMGISQCHNSVLPPMVPLEGEDPSK
jgi:hypothetical protein